MSIENHTTKPISVTSGKESTPNLSEQFKAQRKNKLEERDEKVKIDLGDLFNRYQTSSERNKVITNKLESILHLLSEEQKEYLFNSLEEVVDITDENEFVEKMFPVAKYYLGIKTEQLDQFETVDRQRLYEEHPTYKELNQLFAYELEGDEIRLHVPTNEATSIKDKLRLLNDGLRRLAEMARTNQNIKRVIGRSWIVGKNPKLLERLGFEVSEIETNPEGVSVGEATISREKLISLYGK